MSYLVGQYVGAIVITYILMRLVMLAFRKGKYKPRSVIISACIALIISTILGGYGFADGGPPVFITAFSIYALPALISMGIELFRVSRM